MPRVHGDGIIHFSHFDAVVHHDGPLWIHKTKDGKERFWVDFWGIPKKTLDLLLLVGGGVDPRFIFSWEYMFFLLKKFFHGMY